MLNYIKMIVGPLSCNCYLLWNQQSKTCIIVDPGGDGLEIIKRINTMNLKAIAIIHTHGHFDHLGGSRELQDYWQCPAYINAQDLFLIDTINIQAKTIGFKTNIAKPEVSILNIGEILYNEIKVIATPGHTPGSSCFLFNTNHSKVLLSGDTLFHSSIGCIIHDSMGDLNQLQTSIQKEIYTLDDTTLVLPGHGISTMVGIEANTNPYVRRL